MQLRRGGGTQKNAPETLISQNTQASGLWGCCRHRIHEQTDIKHSPVNNGDANGSYVVSMGGTFLLLSLNLFSSRKAKTGLTTQDQHEVCLTDMWRHTAD